MVSSISSYHAMFRRLLQTKLATQLRQGRVILRMRSHEMFIDSGSATSRGWTSVFFFLKAAQIRGSLGSQVLMLIFRRML
mmetsp:Transcript_9953/g.19156  ORF Transcript_9953/g.19156 Transcript_9953/m.19156 type:complete len:80 (+) Transcript_9953:1350-1589(+)